MLLIDVENNVKYYFKKKSHLYYQDKKPERDGFNNFED